MTRTAVHPAPRGRAAGAAALASVGALVLTGCGGMSGTSTAPAAAEGCEDVDEVSIVLQWVTQAQFASYYAAVDQGFYAEQCLEVTIQEGGTNVVPQQVLSAGNAEFAVSHVTKSMASREEGADLVNIGQVFQRPAYYQVSWADSGLDDLSDLAGTTMGSWGGGNELALYAALRNSGVEPTTQVEVIQQPFDMSLLLDRQADSVQAKPYNEYAQLLETVDPETGELYQPEDFTVIDLAELGFRDLEDGIYARGEWLAEDGNEDVAARFLAASYQGWAACRDDAQSCVDVVLSKGSALGESHQLWMMNEVNRLIWPSPDGIGVMDPVAWDDTIANAVSGGALTEAPAQDAYRTDLTEQALEILAEEDVDTAGEGFEPLEVELKEGGA